MQINGGWKEGTSRSGKPTKGGHKVCKIGAAIFCTAGETSGNH